MTIQRYSTDKYFIEVAKIVAKRSTCLRRQVGAVLVKEKRILSTGYNGAPSGMPHCNLERCYRSRKQISSGKDLDYCYAVHAEANCLIQAAIHGTSILGKTTLYVTLFPCISCLKMILNAKIHRIVYLEGYPDKNPIKKRLLSEASLVVEEFTKK